MNLFPLFTGFDMYPKDLEIIPLGGLVLLSAVCIPGLESWQTRDMELQIGETRNRWRRCVKSCLEQCYRTGLRVHEAADAYTEGLRGRHRGQEVADKRGTS